MTKSLKVLTQEAGSIDRRQLFERPIKVDIVTGGLSKRVSEPEAKPIAYRSLELRRAGREILGRLTNRVCPLFKE